MPRRKQESPANYCSDWFFVPPPGGGVVFLTSKSRTMKPEIQPTVFLEAFVVNFHRLTCTAELNAGQLSLGGIRLRGGLPWVKP